MATNVVLSGTPTEDAALSYTLDPPASVATSQVWESSTNGTVWTPIPGATAPTFTPGDDEAGKSLRVVVQIDEGGTPSTATSDAAVVANLNDLPTGTFTITGTATQGETLTSADLVSDADGTTGGRTYQWEVQTAPDTWTKIDGATDSTFTLTQATVGKSVRAVVSFTDDKGTPESVNSNAIANIAEANIAPGGSLTVEGTLKVGQTVNMADLVYDDDGIAPDGRSYQWQVQNANGDWVPLEGASGNQPFTLTEAQLGRPLRAVVSFTDGDGKAETVLGTPSAPVAAAGNSAPTGVPVLGYGSGNAPVENAAITVDVTAVKDADGVGTFTYAWSREGANGTWSPIAGATGASYTPGDADVGAKLKVEASYTDGGGAKEVVTAETAAAVGNVNDAPTGAIALSGQAVRGQAITASTESLADADGIGPISLQWERADSNGGWAPIAGATAAAYTPAEADVGLVLRAVATWTDGHGTDEKVVAETGAVAAAGKAIELPPPEPGETRENAAADEWTSTDLARMIAEGGTFAPPVGVESVQLADGVLSFGTGTTEAFVARLYLGLLGREGDVEGLAFTGEAARDGFPKAVLADVFLSSAEYKARVGDQTDAEFVQGLYTAFLGRAGDASERGFWTDALDGGVSRAGVASSIAGSAESGSHLQASTTGVFVADVESIYARSLYNCSLGREADAPGLLHWSNVLEQGIALRTLGDQFDESAEFNARHGASTDGAFVESLYQTGMGRQADAAGLDYWTGFLESGQMGRGELALVFSMAQEVRNGLDWPL
ncbi:hypothetical protein GCM10009416_08760 [Craurococcus roseus]|uniref:DUF4214 domain-containing protein n=1 Tax=Craurococcus roseus TaxID=77585 RepID=A0ABN1ER54_9PROT